MAASSGSSGRRRPHTGSGACGNAIPLGRPCLRIFRRQDPGRSSGSQGRLDPGGRLRPLPPSGWCHGGVGLDGGELPSGWLPEVLPDTDRHYELRVRKDVFVRVPGRRLLRASGSRAPTGTDSALREGSPHLPGGPHDRTAPAKLCVPAYVVIDPEHARARGRSRGRKTPLLRRRPTGASRSHCLGRRVRLETSRVRQVLTPPHPLVIVKCDSETAVR